MKYGALVREFNISAKDEEWGFHLQVQIIN